MRNLDVGPYLSVDDLLDEAIGNAKPTGDGAGTVSSAPRDELGADGEDHFFGELCHSVTGASGIAPPAVAVHGVFGVGAGLKVFRVDAGSVVALVADNDASDFVQIEPLGFAVRNAVSLQQLASSMNETVAISALESGPVDAISHVQHPYVESSAYEVHGNWHGNQLSGATLAMQGDFK